MSEPPIRLETGDRLYAAAISAAHDHVGDTLLASISGPQGSGKSTRSKRISHLLSETGKRVVCLSLDDFYLSKNERRSLAIRVHPLLGTRGVPGTHDILLLLHSIQALRHARPASRTVTPVFEKALDDRASSSNWETHCGSFDIIILEGWCLGARPEPTARLNLPVNDLEREHDSDSTWRKYVNSQLEQGYAALRDSIDLSIMFYMDKMDVVRRWRTEQEAELWTSDQLNHGAMSEVGVSNFVDHFERITRWMMEDKPADLIAVLDQNRLPRRWELVPSA